jgi:probable 2-oxoglutarate dehydrogenase E1 component DHKTD1
LNAPLLRYVDSIRTHGHRAARVDPLDIIPREEVAALDPTRYGLVEDFRKYDINGIIWNDTFGSHIDSVEAGKRWWTLGEITSHLRSIYVGRIAYEYMHSPSKTERLWFSHHLESPPPVVPSEKEIQKKKRIHELLIRSETFDAFLQSKFPNLKRYGLEGGESMLVALDTLFSVSSQGL